MNEAAYRSAEQALWRFHGAEPTEHRVRLAIEAVDVRVQEVGNGPPVLFIHGANTSGASWVALASRLPDFRCLIVDRPGTGLSQPLGGKLDAARVARLGDRFVSEILAGMNVASGHVVATSLGGYLALRSAAATPAMVARMVQFSWPVGAPTDWVPWVMRVAGMPVVGRLLAAMPATERSVRMTFRQIGHGPSLDNGRITRVDVATYLALLRNTSTLREDARIGRAFVPPLRGLNRVLLPDALLARVATPTHFIWGERDPFGGPSTADGVARRLPNATLEIVPGAGHAPWLDELDHCVGAIREHLAA